MKYLVFLSVLIINLSLGENCCFENNSQRNEYLLDSNIFNLSYQHALSNIDFDSILFVSNYFPNDQKDSSFFMIIKNRICMKDSGLCHNYKYQNEGYKVVLPSFYSSLEIDSVEIESLYNEYFYNHKELNQHNNTIAYISKIYYNDKMDKAVLLLSIAKHYKLKSFSLYYFVKKTNSWRILEVDRII